jgi:septal ring factor EnvC (AmiA/AmiB activator)
MIREETEQMYRDVQKVLDDAMEKVDNLEIHGDEENAELKAIREQLEKQNEVFKKEIEKLHNSSEWERLCIAFFGETNAGKSTIIESLRIIYDEETRRTDALAQKDNYIALLKKHCEDYQSLISRLEGVNNDLIHYHGNLKWLFYFVAGAIGVAVGLLLANFGIIAW